MLHAFCLWIGILVYWGIEKSLVFFRSSTGEELDSQSTAKALSALAGLLILGLGSVLMISLFGRWIRRMYFSNQRKNRSSPSPESQFGNLAWGTSSTTKKLDVIDETDDELDNETNDEK